ncbi:MAG: hypothetical protein KGH67_06200, partial [Candidatus Micrarchaeota archaeon]|nr:hypothetical protein [Candidatus Micrarchaeota archaeon]
LVYNSVTYTLIGNQLTSSNTYTFQVPASWTTNTLFYANVFVTDTASATGNSVLTSKITVNSALAAPTIAVTNTVVTAGSTYESFQAYETGGTASYTYNFLVYNSVTNTLIGNQLTSSNTYTFLVPSYWTSNNLFYANVFVSDSATVHITQNSVLTSKVTVNTGLATPTIFV